MKSTFSKQYMLNNCGCYSQEQMIEILSSKPNREEFSIMDIVNAKIPLKDKGWFIARKCELSLDEKREFAIGLAETVLEIFETKYPEDKRPREAIQAAKDYMANRITAADLLVKRRDAAAAAAAAAAYAAADAAAYAAADAAAYAAADAAAYAAAAAAAYAAYAADAADAAAADAAAAAAADAADAAAADEKKSKKYSTALLKYLQNFAATHSQQPVNI